MVAVAAVFASWYTAKSECQCRERGQPRTAQHGFCASAGVQCSTSCQSAQAEGRAWVELNWLGLDLDWNKGLWLIRLGGLSEGCHRLVCSSGEAELLCPASVGVTTTAASASSYGHHHHHPLPRPPNTTAIRPLNYLPCPPPPWPASSPTGCSPSHPPRLHLLLDLPLL